MIKPYFVVRSKRKLFLGLSFSISGFVLFYTIITMFVLPENIPWKKFASINNAIYASKYMLLMLPILSVLLCIALYINAKRQKLPRLFCTKAPENSNILENKLTVYSDMMTGNSLLCSMLLGFWQIDRLNIAKNTNRFSPIILILLIIALIGYTIYQALKIIKIKQEK